MANRPIKEPSSATVRALEAATTLIAPSDGERERFTLAAAFVRAHALFVDPDKETA